MNIKGIGVIKKEKAMSILTDDGREAIKSGEISLEELGEMYKHEMTRKKSKIGKCMDTFRRNYDRVPEKLREKLSPEELGELVDAFYQCYAAGKNENRG